MKKLRIIAVVCMAFICLGVFAGCSLFEKGAVNIDHWGFTFEQASGSEIDLSLLSGSTITINLTVFNNGEERELLVDNFKVIYKNGDNQRETDGLYFDGMATSLTFEKDSSANIRLNAVSTTTISASTEIIIKYSGQQICKYLVK